MRSQVENKVTKHNALARGPLFGFVRSLTHLPHFVVTEIIGAMLARYYFWNKYGRQEWRQFAPILAVGFSCGMALMGMAAVGVALIQKSVSVLIF